MRHRSRADSCLCAQKPHASLDNSQIIAPVF